MNSASLSSSSLSSPLSSFSSSLSSPSKSPSKTPTKRTFTSSYYKSPSSIVSPSSSIVSSSPPVSVPSPVSSPSKYSFVKKPSRYYQDKSNSMAVKFSLEEQMTNSDVQSVTENTPTKEKETKEKETEKENEREKEKEKDNAAKAKAIAQNLATKKFLESIVKGRLPEVKKAMQLLNQQGIKLVNCIKVADNKGGKFPWNGWTPLHITAWNGTSDVLQHLLSESQNLPHDVNLINDHCQTPLHIAALRGQYDAAKVLLENGAKVDAENSRRYRQTPLHIASLKGHSKVVELLAEYKSDLGKHNDNSSGPRSALLFACINGYSDIIQELLKQKPSLATTRQETENGLDALRLVMSKRDGYSATLLSMYNNASIGKQIELAIENDLSEILEKLLTQVPSLDDLVAKEKCFVFHRVASTGNKQILSILSSRATPQTLNLKHNFVSPLLQAIRSGRNGEFITALIEAGSEPNKDTSIPCYCDIPSPLQEAINFKNDDAIKILLKRVDISKINTEVVDKDNNSLVHFAALKGVGRDSVRSLASAMPEKVNQENSQGQTPLIIAASRGFDEAAEELLAANANVNFANPQKNNQTALHYAAAKGLTSMLRILLKYGAKVNAEITKAPYNALGQCLAKRYREAADLLLAHGAVETAKREVQVTSGRVQLMSFDDVIPPQYMYKPISLLEREALSQNRGTESIAQQTNVSLAHSSASYQQKPWKTVRVFISSSFKDMHSERTYIVSQVMPALRKKCAQRKVHILEVDLRWGVTEEEAQNGKVLELCLEEINRCNIFVNILGERYGWVPNQKQVPDHVKSKFNWINGNSVTHMEVLQALKNKSIHSIFFHRDSAATNAIPESYRQDFVEEDSAFKSKLKDLKSFTLGKGAQKYNPVYTGVDSNNIPVFGKDLESLGNSLEKQIWAIVDKENPESSAPPDVLQMEREYHDEFVQIRNRRFVGREAVIAQIAREASEFGGKPLVIIGEAGAGKSALMAHTSLVAAKDYIDVYPHFVGASPESTSIRFMLWRLCSEISKRNFLSIDIPEEFEDLVDTFKDVLQQASERSVNTLILIDALNQVDKSGKGHDLYWIPSDLPPRVKIVISCLPGEYYEALRSRNFPEIKVGNLTENDRSEIVTSLLADYNKKLDSTQLRSLLAKKEATNPLFLVVACEELRVFGIYEKISEKIANFADTVPGIFGQVLERLEIEFGESLVRNALVLLNCARHGLLEIELLDILNVSATAWNSLFLKLEFYLRPVGKTGDGQLDFFHRQLAKAVQKRYESYLNEGHEQLAAYFLKKSDPEGNRSFTGLIARSFQELPYHLTSANQNELLNEIMCSIEYIHKRCSLGQTYSLVSEYQQIFSGSDTFMSWSKFVVTNHHIFANYPELVYQQAMNNHDEVIVNGAKNSTLANSEPYILKLNGTTQPAEHIISFVSNSQANTCEFSPYKNGTMDKVVVGYKAGNLSIWDAQTGEEVHKTNAHKQRINSTSYSLDGKKIISCSSDMTDYNIKIWDAKLQNIKSFKVENEEILCAVFHPKKDNIFAATSSVGTVRIWDWQADKVLHTITKHTLPVHKCTFSHDGNYLATACSDRSVILWSTANGSMFRAFSEHNKPVFDVKFSQDDSKLLSVSHKDIKVVEMATGSTISMQGHADTISTCAFSPDSSLVVTGSWDRKIKVWNVETQECVRTIEGHGHMVNCVTISPDGQHILSSSADMTTKLFNTEQAGGDFNGAVHSALIKGMAYCPKTETLVTGAWDNDAKIFNKHGNLLGSLCGHAKRVNAVDVSPDGKKIATASSDNSVKIWDANSLVTTDTYRGHKDKVFYCQFSHDGKYLVSGSCDKTIKVWNVKTGECAGTLVGHTDWVVVVAFSPFSRRLVSGSQDKTLKVWNSETGEDLETLHGHTEIILDAKFSPDGKYIVSCSMDKTIIIWSAVTFKPLRTLRGHSHEVSWVGFFGTNAKTTHVVSTSSDTTVRIWDIETGNQTMIYYCAGAAMVGIVIENNKTIAVGDSLGYLYILELKQVEYDPSKPDIRVAQILEVTKSPSMQKVYCLQVDVGEEKPRTVVSSLVNSYTKEQLVNRRVMCNCSITPATIAGILSNGMLMGTTDSANKVQLFDPPRSLQIGARVHDKDLPSSH